jgi:hypothetical protein
MLDALTVCGRLADRVLIVNMQSCIQSIDEVALVEMMTCGM